MLPQPSSLCVPTIPVATAFYESRLKYMFSCHGKLSTIVGTKKSASNTKVITVASFSPFNFIRFQIFWSKYYLHSVHSLRGSQESILNRKDCKLCRLLKICSWLKNTHQGDLSTSLHQNKERKGLKVWLLPISTLKVKMLRSRWLLRKK